MRSKLLAVMAISSLALVGCSAAETPATPSPTQDVTITEETLAPTASADPEVSASTDTVTRGARSGKNEAEAKYLVEYKQVGGDESLYNKKDLVKFGYEACKIMAEGKSVPHDLTGDSTEDYAVGIAAGIAAKATLCPDVTD